MSVGGGRLDRGQASVVGVALLIAITVIGTGVIVSLGSTAFDGLQDSTDVQRVEHAMTLLDSRGAMTALGDSQRQRVDFGRTGRGTYSIGETESWLRVEHINYTASEPPQNETIYNATLGSFVYQSGATTVAYEGGGVWHYRDGNTTMVSPPEFHYRDATLTLPVIRVDGSGGASGGAVASVSPARESRRIYPNASRPAEGGTGSPYDATTAAYRNPVQNGTVRVTVKSDYYQGWAYYFDSRTDGNVSVDHDRELAVVELDTVGGVNGPFQMPNHGEPIAIQAMGEGHPISQFELTLQDTNNNNFYKHMYWSLYAESGDERLEILVYSPDKQQCTNNKFADLTVGVFYDNGTVTHEWENTSVPHDSGDIRVVCTDLDGDGKEEPRIVVDLAGDTLLHYKEITTPSDRWHFDPSVSADPTATWTQHGDVVSSESGSGITYVKGSDTASMESVTNHYAALLAPDFELLVSETSPSGSRVDELESFGTLVYAQGSGTRYITYLHITENEVRIDVR